MKYPVYSRQLRYETLNNVYKRIFQVSYLVFHSTLYIDIRWQLSFKNSTHPLIIRLTTPSCSLILSCSPWMNVLLSFNCIGSVELRRALRSCFTSSNQTETFCVFLVFFQYTCRYSSTCNKMQYVCRISSFYFISSCLQLISIYKRYMYA